MSILKVSIRQLKAARALVGWSQEQLAFAADISLPTIKRLEAAEGLSPVDKRRVRRFVLLSKKPESISSMRMGVAPAYACASANGRSGENRLKKAALQQPRTMAYVSGSRWRDYRLSTTFGLDSSAKAANRTTEFGIGHRHQLWSHHHFMHLTGLGVRVT